MGILDAPGYEEEIRLKKGGVVKDGLKTRFSSPSYVQNCMTQDKPQAVCHVTSHLKGSSVSKALEYVARVNDASKENIPLEDEYGNEIKGKDGVEHVYQNWKQDFDSFKDELKVGATATLKKGHFKGTVQEIKGDNVDLLFKNKKTGVTFTKTVKKDEIKTRQHRDATHMILSASCKNTPQNNRKVMQAARETAQKMFGDKQYSYAMCLHQDTDNPHVHLIIKTKNNETNKKLRLNPPELFETRQTFADKMTNLGLEHTSTLRKDRPNVLANVQKSLKHLQERESNYKKSLTDDTINIDVVRHKKAMSAGIVRLRDDINKNAAPISIQKYAALYEVRQLEKTLKKQRVTKKELQREVTQTLKRIGVSVKRFDGDCNDFIKSRKEHRRISDRVYKLDVLKKIGGNLDRDIKAAAESIKKAPISKIEKREALTTLRDYTKQMQKANKHYRNIRLDKKLTDAIKDIDRSKGKSDEIDKKAAEIRAKLDKMSEKLPAATIKEKQRQLDTAERVNRPKPIQEHGTKASMPTPAKATTRKEGKSMSIDELKKRYEDFTSLSKERPSLQVDKLKHRKELEQQAKKLMPVVKEKMRNTGLSGDDQKSLKQMEKSFSKVMNKGLSR